MLQSNGEGKNQVVKECQRNAEDALMRKDIKEALRHPYSLSLDVYQSLLSSLVACEYFSLDDSADKIIIIVDDKKSKLEDVLAIAQDFLRSYQSRRSYASLVLHSADSDSSDVLRAKL